MTDIAQLPWETSTKFVKVLCRLGLVAADAEDVDQFPDLRSLGGKVIFSLNTKRVRYLAPTQGRMLVMPDTTYTIQPATGELVDTNGNVGLYLVDPTSDGIDPRYFTYTATVKPDQGEAWSVTFGGSSPLPAEVDLVRMASVLPSAGVSSLEQRVGALESTNSTLTLTDAELDAAMGV